MKPVGRIVLATSAISLLASALLAPAQASATIIYSSSGPISCSSSSGNVYCSETMYGGQQWSYNHNPIYAPANGQSSFSTSCGAQGRTWSVQVTFTGGIGSAYETGACDQTVYDAGAN